MTKNEQPIEHSADVLPFYQRPRFTSASGRTVGFIDVAGLQKLAEEHEWLRDRVARLELTNALLRSVIEVGGVRPCHGLTRP